MSCDNLIFSTSGSTISYRCDQHGGSSAVFKLYSGTVASGSLVSSVA